jgi:hypothetical protein
MCACAETDVRESANDCTLASGEGRSSRGETFHPLYAACPVSSSAERPVVGGCFTPRERVPITHWIGGWVGPRAGLDNMERR